MSLTQHKTTVQIIGVALGFVVVVRKLISFRKQYNDWALMRDKAMDLPHSINEKESSGYFSTQVKEQPIGSFDVDAYGKHFTSGLLACFEKHATNEGLLLTWDNNPYKKWFAGCHVYIKDRTLAKELLSKKNQDKLVKGKPYQVAKPLFGDGVLAANGALWHAQLTVLGRGLTTEILLGRYPDMLKICDGMVAKYKKLLQNKETVDINLCEEMQKAALDVSGEFAFSMDVGTLKFETTADSPVYHAFETVLSTFHRRQFSRSKHNASTWWPSSENIAFDKAIGQINTVCRSIINKRLNDGVAAKPRDVLDVLLTGIKNEDGTFTPIPDSMLMDNMRTLVFGGHIIMGSTLSWAIDMLSKNPIKAQKIVDEFKSKKSEITIETLENCKYLNAVMMEVLRLYPGQMIYRTIAEDIQLGEYYVPKGVEVVVAPYLIQRSDKTIEKVNEFLPERWLDSLTEKTLQGNVAKAGLKGAFLPFSYGQRKCAGSGLALLEMRMILLSLCLNFEFLPSGNLYPKDPLLGVTLYAKDVVVSFKHRK